MSGFLDKCGLDVASMTEEAPSVGGRSFEERETQKDHLKRALSTTRVLAAEKERPAKRESSFATAGEAEGDDVTPGLKKTESEEATIELLQATGDYFPGFTDFEHVFSSDEEEADTDNLVEVCSGQSNGGHLKFPSSLKPCKEDTDATPLGSSVGRRKNTAKRVERTIASTFLPEDFKHSFRITLQTNNLLLREDLWERMKDDFRVIGLLNDGGATTKQGGICFIRTEEIFETLVPLSCTNLCVDSSLYKPVLKHLPLLYSVRLSILRLIGRQMFLRSGQHNDSGQMPVVSLKKSKIIQMVRFFQTCVVDVLPCEDRMKFKRQTRRLPKGGKIVGRTKVHLTELGYEKFSIKSWQPTVDTDILQSILASCKYLDRGREYLPTVFMPTMAAGDVASAGYFRTTSLMVNDSAMPLSSYAWTVDEDQHQVAEMRHNMIIMLSSDVDLCGLFAMKQIWGCDNTFRQQCSALLGFFRIN